METVVTVPNAPGQPDSFPILTTALTMHQPGRTKHGPRIALEHHAREFGEEERGLLLADRLYNGSKPERFQKHVMAMRFRTVYDYKVRNIGLHGAIDDVIFVGGRPYVKWMPQALITARDDFKSGRIDQQTYQSRLAARTGYKLKDHGRPDNEGRQRFTYPDLSKVLCIDPATQKAVKPVLKKKTLTLAPENAESMRVIKHLQHFEHKSPVWREWYGMRSHVESNNQYVKSDAETDLGTRRSAAPWLRVPGSLRRDGLRAIEHTPHRELPGVRIQACHRRLAQAARAAQNRRTRDPAPTLSGRSHRRTEQKPIAPKGAIGVAPAAIPR